MKTITDYSKLAGIEKAAAFILTLTEEQIGKLFSLMDEDEIRELTVTMAQLGKVDSKVVEVLFGDVERELSSKNTFIGTYDSTEKLLHKVLPPDRVSGLMEEIRGPAGRTMWDKLGNVNEEMLASFLKNEYPQTIAVILSKIRTDQAAKVLGILPETLAMEVILRLLKMEPVPKDIMEEIEKTLRSEFMSSLSHSSKRDPHEQIAEIFNFFDRQTESRLMCALEERNAEASERVKSLMFTFDDMVKIDNAGIQVVIRFVDKTKLVLALKGANDRIKELFFTNMSERAAKLMKEDLASLGPVRVRDVDEAQSYVVLQAKELANKGQIVIQTSSNDSGDEIIQ
jgi:flagellar motor switch protein FliG